MHYSILPTPPPPPPASITSRLHKKKPTTVFNSANVAMSHQCSSGVSFYKFTRGITFIYIKITPNTRLESLKLKGYIKNGNAE